MFRLDGFRLVLIFLVSFVMVIAERWPGVGVVILPLLIDTGKDIGCQFVKFVLFVLA